MPIPSQRHRLIHSSLISWFAQFDYPGFNLQLKDSITWKGTPLSRLKA